MVCRLWLPLPALAQPWAGSGTAEDPYQLWDANDVQAIGADPNYWDAHFKLRSDVDMSGYTGTAYNVIGNQTVPFTGLFDGDGHTIRNFNYYAASKDYVGIFGVVDDPGATIKNVQLIDPNVNAGWGNNVGALVAHLKSGTVLKCRVRGGSVSGDHSVGGLVGRASDAELTYCSTATTVSGKGFFAGGLVANIANGQISDNYSVSTVTGSSYVGGLIGLFSSGGFIRNCYSAGSVSATEYVGAFVGRHWDNGAYSKCFWDSTVNPSLDGIGNRTDPNVVGQPTTAMQQMATFTDAGWDFVGESVNGLDDIWDICEGTNYPRLVWEIPRADFVCPDGVTMPDFSVLAAAWMSEPNHPTWNAACDISEPNDGIIDKKDLEVFVQDWLTGL